MEQIQMSTNEFKALSSKTRTEILKMLNERNYTLSELSQKTGMAAPTVKQHATILLDAGLIDLKDEGRKWKYYTLTRKGKKILENNPQKTNILIILASSIIALVGLGMIIAPSLMAPSEQGMGADTLITTDYEINKIDETPKRVMSTEKTEEDYTLFYFAGITLIIAALAITQKDTIIRQLTK